MTPRASAVLLLLGTLACADNAPAPIDAQRLPDPPLTVGGYRLSITNAFFWTPGPRIDLDLDGSFIGHDYETLWDCDGRLTSTEHAALTTALDAASVLSRDGNPQPCADHPIYDLAIEAVSGPAAGRRNAFRYEVCGEESAVPALSEVLELAIAPVRAVQETGTCTGCAPETAERACYEELPYGRERVCVRGEARDCGPANGGDVVACGYALACDADHGWVPGTRWTVREPRVWRWVNLGELSVLLSLTLEIEQPPGIEGLAAFFSHLRIEDPATGVELPFTVPDRTALGQGTPEGSPALVTMTLNGPAAAGAIRTLSAIQVRIRERPWDGLPFGPPIVVAITDAPPK